MNTKASLGWRQINLPIQSASQLSLKKEMQGACSTADSAGRDLSVMKSYFQHGSLSLVLITGPEPTRGRKMFWAYFQQSCQAFSASTCGKVVGIHSYVTLITILFFLHAWFYLILAAATSSWFKARNILPTIWNLILSATLQMVYSMNC